VNPTKIASTGIFNTLEGISVRHGDAGDAVASSKLKNWPLFGQKISILGKAYSYIHV